MPVDPNIGFRSRYVVKEKYGLEPLASKLSEVPSPPAVVRVLIKRSTTRTSSLLEEVVLAFQHTVVAIGTTVTICSAIVPQMGADKGDKARVIQNLLFTAGLNTLLQTAFGSRLPTVMVASSAFLIPVMLIAQDYSTKFFMSEHQRFVYTMRSIQGALVVSSFFNIVVGFSFVWAKIAKYFTHVSIVSIICIAGLENFKSGFTQVAQCMEIGVPMLIILAFFNRYLKAFIERKWSIVVAKFGILISLAMLWAFSALLTVSGAYKNVSQETKMNCRIDSSNLISSSPWVKIPFPFQWGAPIFKASHIFAMIAAGFASASESTAMHYATAWVSGEDPPTHSVLCRSVGMQGVGMLLDGMFGAAVGTTASVDNAGLNGLTLEWSRRVVLISSAFTIFFSIFGKFGAVFSSIPVPIFAAMTCVLSANISGTGISYTQFTDRVDRPRNIYVFGLPLFLGLSVPEYFKSPSSQGSIMTTGKWVKGFVEIIFSSAVVITMCAGSILDKALHTEGDDDAETRRKWIEQQKGVEEYYALPYKQFGDGHRVARFRFRNANKRDGGGGSGSDEGGKGGDNDEDSSSSSGGGGADVGGGGNGITGGGNIGDVEVGCSSDNCNCNNYGNCHCDGICNCDIGRNCNCSSNYNENNIDDSNNPWSRPASIIVRRLSNNDWPNLPRDPCVVM